MDGPRMVERLYLKWSSSFLSFFLTQPILLLDGFHWSEVHKCQIRERELYSFKTSMNKTCIVSWLVFSSDSKLSKETVSFNSFVLKIRIVEHVLDSNLEAKWNTVPIIKKQPCTTSTNFLEKEVYIDTIVIISP